MTALDKMLETLGIADTFLSGVIWTTCVVVLVHVCFITMLSSRRKSHRVYRRYLR